MTDTPPGSLFLNALPCQSSQSHFIAFLLAGFVSPWHRKTGTDAGPRQSFEEKSKKSFKEMSLQKIIFSLQNHFLQSSSCFLSKKKPSRSCRNIIYFHFIFSIFSTFLAGLNPDFFWVTWIISNGDHWPQANLLEFCSYTCRNVVPWRPQGFPLQETIYPLRCCVLVAFHSLQAEG